MKDPRLNRVSIFLDEVGLDQLELADILQVSKDTVSRWCRNASQPSLKMLHRIAEAGKVDMRSLVEPTKWPENGKPSLIEEYQAKYSKKARKK